MNFNDTSSLQVNTTAILPIILENSLIVSVFPDPGLPYIPTPLNNFSAIAVLNQHFSVNGVTINLCVIPKYSYPYFN